MRVPAIPARKIESAKDSRGRITHWHCSECEWTTLHFPGPSSAMALKTISDAFDSHNCAPHKIAKLRRSI
jgi:hypothetical protein